MTSIAATTDVATSPVATPVPPYTLFDANAVTLATFLGSPLAGGGLMAMNYRRLGHVGKGAMVLIATAAVTALAIAITWNIPHGVGAPIALGLMLGMKFCAQKLQGVAVSQHLVRGGKLGSKGLAAGTGLTSGVVLFAIAFGVISQQERAQTGPSIHVDQNDEVYYAGTATKEEAVALGQRLKEDGFFTGQGGDVLLKKSQEGTSLSFILKQGAWDQPGTLDSFELVGQQVAPLIGGFPIKLRLMDSDRKVMVETTVGSAAVGNDHVYYFGTATADQAQKLGQALAANQFFQGKGVDVLLVRHKDGTTISFVVSDGVWNDSESIGEFKVLAKLIAPSVGGLPVTLRLLNSEMETKKEFVVKPGA